MPDTYTPPSSVASAARRGLRMRAKQTPSNRCCTPVGLARANQLANQRSVSLSVIRRMFSYFSRHLVDKQGKDWGNGSKGEQAWLLWGGDAGFAWAKRILNRNEKKALEDLSIVFQSELDKLDEVG